MFLFVALSAALVFSILYTISIGSADIPVESVFGILKDHLFQKDREREAGIWTMPFFQIVWNIRLPRVLFAALCGAGLAICGVVMQALVVNPIADPYLLGISSGASAGASFALLMPLPFFAGQNQTTIMAFIGAVFSSIFFVAI